MEKGSSRISNKKVIKSRSKHSIVSVGTPNEIVEKHDPDSQSKSLKSVEYPDINSGSEAKRRNSNFTDNKNPESKIKVNVVVPNEQTTADELHIIKATSMARKLSVNDLDKDGFIGDITITVDGFGFLNTDGNCELVKRYTFTNENRMQVQIITLGATITSIKVPDKNGVCEDVVLGFDTIDGYLTEANPNLGCTLGRDAFETLQDEHYDGLGNLNWVPSLHDGKLILTHVSENGWHNYRGTVMIKAYFELKNDNSLHVSYSATTTTQTPVNLSLNVFFNLAGHAAKHTELYKHIFTINGDRSIQERTYRLSKFKTRSVGGTVYDLRIPRELGQVIGRSPQNGFDKYYILTKGTEQKMSYAARIIHPDSGRTLEIYTDQEGIQFYTADYFPDNVSHDFIPYELDESFEDEDCDEDSSADVKKSLNSFHQATVYEIKGKNGAKYARHHAFCINSLNLPSEDSKSLENNVLHPGHTYQHRIVYKFGVLEH